MTHTGMSCEVLHTPSTVPCLTSDTHGIGHDLDGSEECAVSHTRHGVPQMPCKRCKRCQRWIASEQDAPQGTPFENDGQPLYAVAIERLGCNGQPLPGSGQMFHIHAHDVAQALMHFKTVFPNRRTHRIVGAAPCIGFFVANQQGTIVSAT